MNFVSIQISLAASICALVACAVGLKGPGLTGLTKAVAVSVAYLVSDISRLR